MMDEVDFDLLADPEESRVLSAALDSYRQYRRAAHYNITHLRRRSFYALPAAHVELLSGPPFELPKLFQAVDDAIDSNADIAEAFLRTGLTHFGLSPESESWCNTASRDDLDKARITIRQLYRDWSAEGLPERYASYSTITIALELCLPSVPSKRSQYRVLVPGAGIGRLVFELCAAGYVVEGNEISYHQFLASNYILNHTRAARQHKLYPWALSFSNHVQRANQLRYVDIPDIHPAVVLELTAEHHDVHYSERMSMTSGDFSIMYRQPEYKDVFDSVVTCFFIDTAPNIINYIETVKSCLRPGGFWINTGPLLWHFESRSPKTAAESGRQNDASSEADPEGISRGIGDPGAFELGDDQVLALVASFGFDILEHKAATPTGYIQDPDSMLQNIYRPSSWVARKQ